MNEKRYIEISRLAGELMRKSTGGYENWTAYLRTAAQFYKYPFAHQLLIHAQKPDAVACAELTVWNRYGRYVRRGSRGIALPEREGNRSRLRYVFDLSDTEGGKRPYLWKMKPEYRESVQKSLSAHYELSERKLFPVQLKEIAHISVENRTEDYLDKLKETVGGSFVGGLNDTALRAAFQESMKNSAAYILLTRCGLNGDAYFDESDFKAVYQFNTVPVIAQLGTACQEISEETLRVIERAVHELAREEYKNKKTEKPLAISSETAYTKDSGNALKRESKSEKGGNANDNRIDVSSGRGLPDTGFEDGRTTGAAAGGNREIRPYAGELPERSQPGEMVGAAPDRPDGSTSSGDGPESAGDGQNPDKGNVGTGGRKRSVEKVRSNGVGASDQQHQTAGGGNGSDGNRLPVNHLTKQEAAAGNIPAVFVSERSESEASELDAPEQEGIQLSLFSPSEYSVPPEPGEIPEDFRADAADSISPGVQLTIDGRRMEIDSVDDENGRVRLKDLETQGYFPVFREESISLVREYVKPKRELEAVVIDRTEKRAEPEIEGRNFQIADEHLGEGGQKTKYRNNVSAIRLLKRLETENRFAAPEEQETLSKYVGWGGLAQAFDPENETWAKEYGELNGLLTPEEYESARRSTLNAHYTSPAVIRAVYSALEGMGFRDGNLLEPSCGVGNFFGLLPESMGRTRLYGVELDSVSGRIAQKLYPKAHIQIQGFERTSFSDNFFDAAVGNVPFGGYSIPDQRYDRYHLQIHDYFIAKTLDKVRPGGVVAFVTSKGTLDKQDTAARRYLSQRAELLGAVRLPNTAFQANAGTEVTADILFLQKREIPALEEPEWISLSQTEDGVPVNRYYASHPDMLLGRMVFDERMYGGAKETACHPLPERDWKEQLQQAVRRIVEQRSKGVSFQENRKPEKKSTPAVPAVSGAGNYSYCLWEGKLWFRENADMRRVEASGAVLSRMTALVELRDCVKQLIQYQTENASDDMIVKQREKLNRLYDQFQAVYGLLHDKANEKVFFDDASWPLLCSLEYLNEAGKLERKADIFTKRTIYPHKPVTHCDTAADALGVSIGEKACVDMELMSGLTGQTSEELERELQGVIFQNPDRLDLNGNSVWETADEYLSGNVVKKLESARRAAAANPRYQVNVQCLEKARPPLLEATEIDVRLGTEWIPIEVYRQFMREALHASSMVKLEYSSLTHRWNLTGKGRDYGNVKVYQTYGTDRMNAYYILEQTLNLQAVRIFDHIKTSDGERTVINREETYAAQQKQNALKQAFQEWIYQDPQRRRELTEKYNNEMNCIAPRKYDGGFIQFSGMNAEISLRPYQRDGVARILYGGNSLIAHCVGAGKTMTLIAAAMEGKRLGLCHKSMVAVPKHLTGQWGAEILRLYPSANVLVVRDKDFEKQNRRVFCSRIATGDWDIVVIGHSQFEKIPVSPERQEAAIRQQIGELEESIREMKKSDGARFSVKQLEKAKVALETRLNRLLTLPRDDTVTFEELGVDRLMIDEADLYKNLSFATKLHNVAGISQSDAKRAMDLLLKCRYMDEITQGRGVVFATGTPVSNSIAELYTMLRYLSAPRLEEMRLSAFDAWITAFGECVSKPELKPEGKGYQVKTRFSKFFNLSELMNLFREIADIQTADMLQLPKPHVRYHTVSQQASAFQKEIIETLAKRAERVRNGSVDSKADNLLKITGDGRKLALDQRLINPLLPDDPDSKVNACVKNILEIWKKSLEARSAQLVFCDMSVPKENGAQARRETDGEPSGPVQAEEEEAEPEGFCSVYSDIRAKLIAGGIPEKEIAFIHDAKTDKQKENLFSKVRSGSVRVLLGSTEKMGAGTNVQTKLIAEHHLDCPWRPRDLTQREGRILRFGNENPEVDIYRYITVDSFDAFMWQTIENKQRFISQIMSGKNPARQCMDVDETVLSFAEIKALATGNPAFKEKMELEMEVERLAGLERHYKRQQYEMQDLAQKEIPEIIQNLERKIACLKEDGKTAAAHPSGNGEDFCGLELEGKTWTDKKEAGRALLTLCGSLQREERREIGSYRGFGLQIGFETSGLTPPQLILSLRGKASLSVKMGPDALGNLTRMENRLNGLPQDLLQAEKELEDTKKNLSEIKEELRKPFGLKEELTWKSARLKELNAMIEKDLTQNTHPVSETASSKASVIERLEEKKRQAAANTLSNAKKTPVYERR